MTIKFKLLPDGGFVCGDTETRRTSYAYPSSIYATQAKREAAKVAAEMCANEKECPALPESVADYDARNWQILEAWPRIKGASVTVRLYVESLPAPRGLSVG